MTAPIQQGLSSTSAWRGQEGRGVAPLVGELMGLVHELEALLQRAGSGHEGAAGGGHVADGHAHHHGGGHGHHASTQPSGPVATPMLPPSEPSSAPPSGELPRAIPALAAGATLPGAAPSSPGPQPAPASATADAPSAAPTPGPATSPAPASPAPAGSSSVGAPAPAAHYDPPIVITKGGTYSGNWRSDDPSKPAVTIATTEPVTIENANITGKGDLIKATGGNADLTVRNTTGTSLNPDVAGQQNGRFVNAFQARNLQIENNKLEQTSGINVVGFTGDGSPNQAVKITGNDMHNIDGRLSNGQGGYQDVQPQEAGKDPVHAIMLNDVHAPNTDVGWNRIKNDPGQSQVEDVINLYKSSGTAGSPLSVHNNLIDGAYATVPQSQHYTGGGIITDGDAKVGSSYAAVRDNVVLNTGNYGINNGAGHDNVWSGNQVFSSGALPDGERVATQNSGIINKNFMGEQDFGHNTMANNTVDYANTAGQTNHSSDVWTPDGSATGTTELTEAVTPDTINQLTQAWLQQREAQGT